MEPSTPKTSPVIPIAIVCGFALIALAIYFTAGKNAPTPVTGTEDAASAVATTPTGVPKAVTEADYIRGNPNAPIIMIEYSDYDCPFCKQFHNTMGQIMDEYGITGRIAWVYRQFPLIQLHPNSPKVSEAALCVGDIGGQDAFWTFSDLIFEARDVTEQTNVTKLADYAVTAGVTQADYIACMDSGRMEAAVKASIEDGFNAGVRGTPHTFLIVGNQQAVIDGAQPYDVVKGIVENLIGQLDGNVDPTATPVAPQPTTTTPPATGAAPAVVPPSAQ